MAIHRLLSISHRLVANVILSGRISENLFIHSLKFKRERERERERQREGEVSKKIKSERNFGL